MRFDKYRQALAVPGFRSVLLLGIVAKLPVVAIPIVLTLQVALGLRHGFGEAGLVTGLWTVGVTVGAPIQGRLIDRRGLRPVLAVATVCQGLFWCLAPLMPFPVFAVGALVSGLVLVPGSTVVRLAISGLVPGDQRHTAFALDSMVTELSYMGGPALAVLIATQVSTGASLVGVGSALVLSGGAMLLRNPPMEEKKNEPGPSAVWPGARRQWLTGRLAGVFASTLAAGAVVAGYEVSITATLRSLGQVQWTGMVLLGCGVYSLLGGLVFGALPRSVPVPAVIALLGLATVPLGLAGNWWLLGLAVAPAATLCAPAFASTASAAGESAADGTRARVMSLYGSALSAGTALGAPLAGAAFDAGGSRAAFAAVGGLGVLVAIVAWPALRRRREPACDPSAPTVQNVTQDR